MEIKRERYLNKLLQVKDNGRVKIITGIRRCGKSYLLLNIFKSFLIQDGVDESQIIEIALEEIENIEYRNPFKLYEYIISRTLDKSKRYYVMIDEIQFCQEIENPSLPKGGEKINFTDVALSLSKKHNIDLYITGSNSKMLSKDILTQFRDRGDEIKVYPLSYYEYYNATADKSNAWKDYLTYGGMPYTSYLKTYEEKTNYLKNLFSLTYIKDVVEHNQLKENEKEALEILLDFTASSIDSLSNISKLENRFRSDAHMNISRETISSLLSHLEDAFIIEKAKRYDVKGGRYFNTPLKYYFTDVGLRNARINFRQNEENHIMENIIYNELINRGYFVDVGVVESIEKTAEGKSERNALEVDFVVNHLSKRIYIQSALTISFEEKMKQELKSLEKIKDSFPKIIITGDDIHPWYNKKGILFLNIKDFLLNEDYLRLY